MQQSSAFRSRFAALVSTALIAGSALAFDPKEQTNFLDLQQFSAPELYLSSEHVALGDALAELPNRAEWEAFLAERADAPGGLQIFLDARSGAATNLLAPFPLLPGDGFANQVSFAALGERIGRTVTAIDADVVAAATRDFVVDHAGLLGIDPAELGPVTAAEITADYWQVSAPQRVDGVEVRHARLVATVRHGNIVTIGTESWGRVGRTVAPALAAEVALERGFQYVGGKTAADVLLSAPKLEWVPVAPQELQAGEAFAGAIGQGYRHRLVWTFMFRRDPDHATWELMLDAGSGDVLALEDKNQYVERTISGGVYPSTATGICPNPGQCGIMQSDWPMPYANTGLAAPNNFTNGAGVLDWTAGGFTTTLSGRYFRMLDNCGAISAPSPSGNDLDLGGSNNQHDCTTGTGGGAGNTPASRSGFYELNRIAEQARGWLPANAWLGTQVTSNMNINQTCNAFWSPGAGTVNFYRSGGGCRNTGEIAGVFDHEWGHGMDDNDAGGALSSSSEGYADIAMVYRLQTSCIGHGFFHTANLGCGTTADGTGFNANEAQTGPQHCDLDCSGVRDADFAKHNPNTPDTPLGFVCTSCNPSGGPCGRQVHCAAAPSRQAAWDLVARDLPAPPFNLDSQTSFLIGSKVFYHGSGNIVSWHACTCGSSASGCGATNAYMQWLGADDDNGNLNDGTPHMTAIHAAFDRHGIACAAPVPVNSGCASGPSTAPTLTVVPGNFQNQLSWTTVPGATRYWVMRTEGHAGCDLGKTRIADITGTTYTDEDVVNGRTYYYNVVAQGTSTSCYSPVSTCVNATPQLGFFTLTAAVTGSGDVTSNPAGITCPGDCTEDYAGGSLVDLSQSADPGFAFTGWSGDCTGTGACQVTMSADRSVTATFEPTHALTVTVVGPGSVASTPAGIACPSDCDEQFLSGTGVDLDATPGTDAFLVGWSGDCTGNGACNVSMSAARSVTATFDTMPFVDGFESADTSRWSAVVDSRPAAE
jgi:uncharacterized repeat protein (TIGR02543 family)